MSNLVTVFSPEGEQFEVTPLNAKDLTTHAGWTFEPKNSTSLTPPPAAKPIPAPASEPTPVPNPPVHHSAVVTPPAAEEETEATKRLTVEDFADLEDKAAVRAYIEATFPEAEIDGRSNRDKLVSLAIELATAAE